MRLPNGYGSVSRNPGNRRRPYIVRKTVGWHYENGKKVRDTVVIGYAESREEGLQLLAEYNNRPLSSNKLDMSFGDVYKQWSLQKYKAISKSSRDSYIAAYSACQPLVKTRFRGLKLIDLQDLIDGCGKNYPTLKKIKVLLCQLYDYAIKHEICNKDYASMIDLSAHRLENPDSRPHERFTYDEVCAIWEQKDDPYIQTILMLIYSGVRVSELLDLKKENVHLDKHYFEVIQSKTTAGVRTVPIADCVYPFWVSWYHLNEDSPYIICTSRGAHFSYSSYSKRYYKNSLSGLGINKTTHSCRYTCISLLQESGVDKVMIKKLVGHSSEDVTEKVYTHPDVSSMLEAVNKIPHP